MAILVTKSKKEERMLQIGSNKFELVDFRLMDYQVGADLTTSKPIYEGVYGINIAKVREINKITTFTKMPNTHNCIEGILELREEAIPVVNLAKFLGYNNHAIRPTDNIILCEFNSLVTGFIVHQANKIRRISWEAILPPTRLIGREGGCVTGMHKLIKDRDNNDDLMLLILDFEKIVAEINGETDMLHRFEEEKMSNHWDPAVDETKTVLLLDDSQTARSQVELFLSQHGFKTITGTDGEEGLSLLNSLYEQAEALGKNILDLVQVVITDVEMPRMDGHAFTQTVKKDPRFKQLPILMHTSLSGRANMETGKSLADEYIVKFNGEALLSSVEKAWKGVMEKRRLLNEEKNGQQNKPLLKSS